MDSEKGSPVMGERGKSTPGRPVCSWGPGCAGVCGSLKDCPGPGTEAAESVASTFLPLPPCSGHFRSEGRA